MCLSRPSWKKRMWTIPFMKCRSCSNGSVWTIWYVICCTWMPRRPTCRTGRKSSENSSPLNIACALGWLGNISNCRMLTNPCMKPSFMAGSPTTAEWKSRSWIPKTSNVTARKSIWKDWADCWFQVALANEASKERFKPRGMRAKPICLISVYVSACRSRRLNLPEMSWNCPKPIRRSSIPQPLTPS